MLFHVSNLSLREGDNDASMRYGGRVKALGASIRNNVTTYSKRFKSNRLPCEYRGYIYRKNRRSYKSLSGKRL